MAMKYDNEVLIWCLLGLAVVILILLLPVVEPLDVEHNTCYLFNYTTGINSTNMSEEFCSPLCDQNISYVNQTVYINDTINYTNSVGINLSINPGEFISGQVDNCFYDVNASNSSQSSELCSIDRVLDDGERYVIENGACNLDITCKDAPQCAQFEHNVTYYEDVRIYRDGGTIFLSWLGEERQYDVDTKAWSYTDELTFVCPESVDLTELEDSRETLELCENVFGSSDWLPKTLDRCLNDRDAIESRAANFDVEISEKTQEIGTLSGKLESCQAQLSTRETLLNDTRQRLGKDTTTLEEELEDKNSTNIVLIMTNIIFLVLSVFLFIIIMKQMGGNSKGWK